MVLALPRPWPTNEYAYPGTSSSLLLWNEFYTSLIPDLLFTPWPNMQVGLPDVWLDRNDCRGTRLPVSPKWKSQKEAEEHRVYPASLQLITLEMSQSNVEQILVKTSSLWKFNEGLSSVGSGKSVSHPCRCWKLFPAALKLHILCNQWHACTTRQKGKYIYNIFTTTT